MRNFTNYLFLIIIMAFLFNCGGGAGSSGSNKETTSTSNIRLQSITITSNNKIVPNGIIEQFTATGTYSNNTTKDITNYVDWSSSNTNIAKIITAKNGAIQTESPGISTIIATDPATGISGSSNLIVTTAALQFISITPSNTSIPKGLPLQFTATGTYSDGTTYNVTNSIIWSSSNTNVATISNDSGNNGLTTTKSIGQTSIIATDPITGITISDSLTVTAAILESITITASSSSVPSGLPVQFTATGTYSDGTIHNINDSITWSSSNTSVATINNGLATTKSAGKATIVATDPNTKTSISYILTVTSVALQSIAITPNNSNLANGLSRQFSAVGTYSDGTKIDITNTVTWTSSNMNIATISNASDSHGLVDALFPGITRIDAIDSTTKLSSSTNLTVTDAVLESITISPTNSYIPMGRKTFRYSVSGIFSDGSTQDLTNVASFTSLKTGVATISSSGVITTVAQGTTSITAIVATSVESVAQTFRNSTTLAIGPVVMESLVISPSDLSIPNYKTQQFTATGVYSNESREDLTNSVVWSSSNTLVASISESGLAIAKSKGATIIKAILTSSGLNSNITLTVNNPTILAHAYIASDKNGTISACPININYEFESCSIAATGFIRPQSIVINGNHAYISNSRSNTITTCSFESTSSNLTNCNSAVVSSYFPTQIAISGNYLYAGTEAGSNSLIKCNVGNNGILSGCTTIAALGTTGVATTNKYLYMTSSINTVGLHSINDSGMLTFINSTASELLYGQNQISINGSSIYVTNQITNLILLCTIGNNGMLNSCKTSGAEGYLNDPYGMDFYDNHVYITNYIGRTITLCNNDASGLLTGCKIITNGFVEPTGIAIKK